MKLSHLTKEQLLERYIELRAKFSLIKNRATMRRISRAKASEALKIRKEMKKIIALCEQNYEFDAFFHANIFK
jgi:hypothetical protein